MELLLDVIALASRDPSRLQAFLCDVFEFDLDSTTQIVSKGIVNFVIVENLNVSTSPAKDEYFFSVSAPVLLDELTSKFNFFIYRNPSFQDFFETIEYLDNETRQSLFFVDIDNRKWHFTYKKGVF